MDDHDRAQAVELFEWGLRQKSAIRPASSAPTPLECEDCGEPIPAARRNAAPGCTRCIECQKLKETTTHALR